MVFAYVYELLCKTSWTDYLRSPLGSFMSSPSKVSEGEEPEGTLFAACTARRSVFPRSYVKRDVPRAVVDRLLSAAMYAPYHGPKPPWRFVVLGRQAMVDMQRLTLSFYDENWRDLGKHSTEYEYQRWRSKTEEEITGRWGPVSYMIAIVVKRQAGSKRVPMWEEICATACAVQNMHLQASRHPGLACYWSSWHAAARDSEDMAEYLGMGSEDQCLGFFIVAACDPTFNPRRCRYPEVHLDTDWRVDGPKS